MAGKVCWKKFAHPVKVGFFDANAKADGTWFRKNFPM